MIEGLHVAPIDPADVDAVAALMRLLPQVSSRSDQVTADRIRQVLAEPGTTVIVARLGDRIVGAATLVRLVTLVGQFGYVEEVVVDESVRGSGVGKALIEELTTMGRVEGLDFLELTSRPTREAANGLYRSMGFKQRQTNVFRLDLR